MPRDIDEELADYPMLLRELDLDAKVENARFKGARDEHLAADNRERCRDIQNPV